MSAPIRASKLDSNPITGHKTANLHTEESSNSTWCENYGSDRYQMSTAGRIHHKISLCQGRLLNLGEGRAQSIGLLAISFALTVS